MQTFHKTKEYEEKYFLPVLWSSPGYRKNIEKEQNIMKKTIATILAVLCFLVFIGCQQQQPDKLVAFEVGLEDNTPDSNSTEVILPAEEAPKTTASESTEATTNTVPTVNPTTETTEETETTEPIQPTSVNKDKSPIKPKTKASKPTSTQPAPTPTESKTTQPKTELTVTTPTLPETEPTKPEPTQPETKPIVPETKPTEPIGCSHDWKTIHHKEKGHWKAGIVCDCGWTIYGNADELISKWNAHSASYPAEEALFEHGGYGSADKWIVDEPAYDEWVCRHCGEPKS